MRQQSHDWNLLYVLAQLSKQSRTDSTCFDEVDGPYDYCKLVFHCRRQSIENQSFSGSRSEFQLLGVR